MSRQDIGVIVLPVADRHASPPSDRNLLLIVPFETVASGYHIRRRRQLQILAGGGDNADRSVDQAVADHGLRLAQA